MCWHINVLLDLFQRHVLSRRYIALVSLLLVAGLFPSSHYAKSFADEQMLDRLFENYESAARDRGIALNSLLAHLEDKPVNEKLVEVNRFFNNFTFEEDITLWKVEDYWATPEEFIGVYQGDCEDYVISKYFALRALGVEDERLYLTYVKATRENIAHMVLSYFESPTDIPLILDNYELRIVSADKRTDLLPVYSFNAKSLFLTNASAGLGQALPTDKVKNSKWEKLLANVEEMSS